MFWFLILRFLRSETWGALPTKDINLLMKPSRLRETVPTRLLSCFTTTLKMIGDVGDLDATSIFWEAWYYSFSWMYLLQQRSLRRCSLIITPSAGLDLMHRYCLTCVMHLTKSLMISVVTFL